MLRLTFRPKQAVFISDNIKVVILRIDKVHNTVELGFDAPREIKILRQHIYQRQKEARQEEQTNQENVEE